MILLPKRVQRDLILEYHNMGRFRSCFVLSFRISISRKFIFEELFDQVIVYTNE